MNLDPSHIKQRLRKRLSIRSDQMLIDQGWYDAHARSTMDPVFIGGCGRSGTTLFKELLNRHSRCACGPETSLYGLPFNIENIAAPWDMDADHLRLLQSKSKNLIEFADQFAAEFLESEHKQRWVEKTPNNVRAIDRLLTWYPKCKFIHVVRDGRDVVCSLRHHPKERVIDGKIVAVHNNHPVERSATRWIKDTTMGLAYKDHPRCLEVRYETLVSDPQSQLKRVCAFIGEAFEPAMLDPDSDSNSRSGQNLNNAGAARPISAQSVGRWTTDLRADERDAFVDIAGELMIALGYVSDHTWVNDFGGRA